MPEYTIKVKITQSEINDWLADLTNEMRDLAFSELLDQTGVDNVSEKSQPAKRIFGKMKKEVKAHMPKLIDKALKEVQRLASGSLISDVMYDGLLYEEVDTKALTDVYKRTVKELVNSPQIMKEAEKHEKQVRIMKLAELRRLAEQLNVEVDIPAQ